MPWPVDIARAVNVGAVLVAAMGAYEPCLIDSARLVGYVAFSTGLRSIGRIDID